VAGESAFKVEVLTPEGEVFNGEVEMISTRTTAGSIGVLRNHAALMAMLEPGELRLYDSKEDGLAANPEKARRFAQAEGYLQMAENRALVLVEEAIPPQDLDRSSLETRAKEAREAAERAEEGSEERNRAERDAKRYEAFLEVAGSSS
jgi:F-type H+-transporting ATPase subunit epsilon